MIFYFLSSFFLWSIGIFLIGSYKGYCEGLDDSIKIVKRKLRERGK